MLVADFELINPGALAAGTDAKTKAGQGFVKDDRLSLARWKLERAMVFCVSFISAPFEKSSQSWEDHGKIATAFWCSLVPIIN